MTPFVAGYVLFDVVESMFVGRDSSSGGYPWKSLSIQGITIFKSRKEAIEYRGISGFVAFGSSNWAVRMLVVDGEIIS